MVRGIEYSLGTSLTDAMCDIGYRLNNLGITIEIAIAPSTLACHGTLLDRLATALANR